ncbi:hypothetical protein [Kouleothrix sp.]|jgi:hypothetical protein|uniref:hypothetical protein n=1 Tax=Kouleothrix sp. TaxID=2779161 RepID=UPI00391BB6D5
MEAKFLGLPIAVWGGLCLVVAAVFVVVWPKDRVADAGALRLFVVRWFHALVWVFLAASCFLRMRPELGGLANRVAFAALITYLIFMASLFVRY